MILNAPQLIYIIKKIVSIFVEKFIMYMISFLYQNNKLPIEFIRDSKVHLNYNKKMKWPTYKTRG